MKVLITGGAGFIGFYLASSCIERGFETHICDNNIRGQHDEVLKSVLSNKDAKYLKIDLTNPKQVESIDKDYDIVFHLAAINGTENFYKIPYTVMDVAISSTMLLLSHFKGTGVKFVFSSSSETYAGHVQSNPDLIPTSEDVPCTIDDVLNERFSYGGSKLACEILINSFSKQYGLDYQIVRYHNVYGPRMGTKHVIPQIINRAKNAESPFIIYGPEQTRAFCYVSDAVSMTMDLSLKNIDGIFHIGNDLEEVKIREIAKTIVDWYNHKPEIKSVPPPQGSVVRRCPNINKVRSILGYSPKVLLSEGLEKTIKWYDEWYNSNKMGEIL